jgi:hypothetical protein
MPLAVQQTALPIPLLAPLLSIAGLLIAPLVISKLVAGSFFDPLAASGDRLALHDAASLDNHEFYT